VKRIRSILTVVLAAVTVLAVPMSFVFGSVLQSGLAGLLRIKVSPVFAGGEELARFRDPVGDDTGAGSLSYPLHPGFDGAHGLDLVRYTVFRPQVGAAWSDPWDFWQLSLTMADLRPDDGAAGFAGPVVDIYIGLGEPGGSTETVSSRAELVSFDPSHPWNLMLRIDGGHRKARLRSADGGIDEDILLVVNREKKSLTVRLPLDRPLVAKVLDGRPTWHYVLVGAYDPLASGGFMALRETAGLQAGGGSNSRLTPKVFDCLAPKGTTQAAILGSFDEEAGLPAMVRPVEVLAFDPAGPGRAGPFATAKQADSAGRDRLVAELSRQVEAEKRAAAVPFADQAAEPRNPADPELDRAVDLFNRGKAAEADQALAAILTQRPDDPVALAYRGSATAQLGGESSSTAEAVRLVNLAYQYLDRAAALAGDDQVPEVFINRGSVSLAVPESVFRKSRQAAVDFERVAGWYEKRLAGSDGVAAAGLARQLAECRFKVGQALEQAGAADEAELAFQRTAALPGLPAWIRLELAKRDLLGD
jgi:hypothetical protein